MLSKFLRKSARRASSAVGRAAKRRVSRALPSFATPKSWNSTESKKSKKTKSKESKPKQKSWGTLLDTKTDAQFWGRALGLAYSRLKGSRKGSPVVLLVEPPTSPKKEGLSAKEKKKLAEYEDYTGPLSTPEREEYANLYSRSLKSGGKKEGLRRRQKGERTLTDPRFDRTQAKYEARKLAEKEAKFRRDNDHLFDVSVPGTAKSKSLLLSKSMVAARMGSKFLNLPRLQ